MARYIALISVVVITLVALFFVATAKGTATTHFQTAQWFPDNSGYWHGH